MKFKLWLDTGYVGGYQEQFLELSPEQITGKAAEQIDKIVEGEWIDFLNNHINGGWEKLEDAA